MTWQVAYLDEAALVNDFDLSPGGRQGGGREAGRRLRFGAEEGDPNPITVHCNPNAL